MAMDLSSCERSDEDYIDMEVSSSSTTTIFCYNTSPPHPREFEFPMSSNCLEREPTTSPADELFYKGKLLPLHLPPRSQMVQKLLQNSNTSTYASNLELFGEHYHIPFTNTTTTTFSTPFESCNISPSDSCQVSRELNPDEYFYECSTEVSSFIGENPKKSWSKKLKLIKQSSLGLKIKASRAYLKSLFSKSRCSDESCAEATRSGDEGAVSKARDSLNKYMKVVKKNPFGQIQRERYQIADTLTMSIGKEKLNEDGGGGGGVHRRSFSGAIKRHLTANSSSSSSSSGSSNSSSFSSNSNGFYELQLLKRSSSANSEIESSIQGAIAHCKQSQQLFHLKKTANEVGFCSLSPSRIAICEDQPGLYRG